MLELSNSCCLVSRLFWLLCGFTRFLNSQNMQSRPFGENGRFEYKHSFRAPHLADKDGTISFWTVTGDAMPSSDQIRLAPSMKSKAGSVWNVKPMIEAEFWAVEISLKISGLGTLGADGLAFWYTDSFGQRGSAFGSSEKWNGLGIFFDSYANDNKNSVAPFVGLMLNNGSIEYDQNRDGGDQILAKCEKDFRNRNHPVRAKIEYSPNKNTVSVHIRNGNTADSQYEPCLNVENVFLPKNGYFGISAATGGLSDDHDVTSFEVWSYSPVSTRQAKSASLPAEEKQKNDDEFERQRKEYAEARERFQKEHPEIVEPIQEIENPVQRGIRQMLEMQTSTYLFCQQLDVKLSQITQMQQNIIQSIGQPSSQQHPPGQAGISQQMPADSTSLHRNEAVEMLQASREISTIIRDIKNYVVDVQNRVMVVDQRLTSAAAGGHQIPAGGSDADFSKSYLEAIKREVEQIRLHQRTQAISCPSMDSSCLSSTVFLFVILVQTAVFVIFTMFKGRNEKAKFY